MAREGLTGSRIRERRVMQGLRQAELARQIGISASYLNLIEHNRRRIGGKLLLDIAAALGVEPPALTEGAEAQLIATLREAGETANLAEVEAERADEFAGRFPGWADVLAGAHRRVAALERTVETLSDRLAHDPQLAATVHEVLSTAAAIRSTASILVEDADLTPDWRNRFHGNIDADSRRLSDSAKLLVGLLDAEEENAEAASSPQEEVEAFLTSRGYSFPELEAGETDVDAVLTGAGELGSVAARHIAQGVLERVVEDSAEVPMAALQEAVGETGPDPVALSRHFDAPVARVMRRLAALPGLPFGLVVCDRSGSLLFRKSVPGFVIPRYGAACPLWPLFRVLAQPGQVVSERLEHLGRTSAVFQCYAVAEPVGQPVYNAPPLLHATMLILPLGQAEAEDGPAPQRVGSTCRVCPRGNCAGRREPSILSEGF